jgi:hypothetical protein
MSEQVWKKDENGKEYCDYEAFDRVLAAYVGSITESVGEYKKRMDNHDVKGSLEIII